MCHFRGGQDKGYETIQAKVAEYVEQIRNTRATKIKQDFMERKVAQSSQPQFSHLVEWYCSYYEAGEF